MFMKIKFKWFKFGEFMAIRQIRQSFPPPNIPSIQYTVGGPIIQMVF